jgi:hypothetical protein
MNLKDDLEINLNNVDPNPAKKELYKLMANSFFGKFQQKRKISKSIFVQNQEQLEELYFQSDTEFKNIVCISDKICQVQLEPKIKSHSPPDRLRNCYIGGQICAYAREVIYEHMSTVERSGGEIFYVDCDSLIFSLPIDIPNPLKISHALGDFKHVLDGNILEFFSFSVKNYSILYENNGVKNYVTKVKGLSFHTVHNELNHDIYKEMMEKAFHEQKQSLYLCQPKNFHKDRNVQKCLQNFTFTNSMSSKRVFSNECTYPYGYKLFPKKRVNEKI